MTSHELEIVNLLGDCYNLFLELEEQHPMDNGEFCKGIHILQRQVMARDARRNHKDIFNVKEVI